MRAFAVLLVLLFVTACSPAGRRDATAPRPLMLEDAASGITAVSAVGARSVKLLHLSPPSIVLLREVFVPPGEHVVRMGVAPATRALIIETDAARFALDPRSGRLALLEVVRPAFAAAAAPPGR